MARRRTNYNPDTRTKILDSHTQFMGGLKTVDTDDSLKDFFLRDAENISLSEFGFLERRYGLVEDKNLEFLVDVETEFDLPNTDDVIYKDRLQGYFEYTRKDKIVEQIIFYNGRLYLNGVQVTQLYQYPSKFDAILGNYNNNISVNDFQEYLERVHNYSGFTSFSSIDDLFRTGRQVEGVRIDDRMFFFTGVYPIVYQGTGEFYLLPEYVTNFEQLALFSHNLHTSDLNATYAAGFPASDITLDMTNETRGYFADLGYAPMYPYMMGEGAGFEIRLNYKLPPISDYTLANFTGFLTAEGTPVTGAAGKYIQMVPEVYYRGSGLSADVINEATVTEVIGDVIVDETWTKVAESNIEYTVLSNLSSSSTVREDPLVFFHSLSPQRTASFVDLEKAYQAEALYSEEQNSFNILVKNIPSGLYDILVVYKIYKAYWASGGTEIIEEIIDQTPEIIRNITFTREKTDDYVNVVTDDEGNEIPVPVNDPAALWTCNRVLNHYGKLMTYGSLIHPERVFISHPTYIHYFPYFFTRDFETDTQESIQQITPFMNILVVQSETYSWGLKGIDAVLGAQNFYTPFVISPIYGTIAPKSVRPVRNQLFFLSQDGIVSIQSLYAIDEQYNVKHIDKNIENIVPLDPEAVAIQYDNQYWIQFPNTKNNMTLRYHVDLKAWMKDTYFEYNGLNIDGQPVLSETVFNGVHKYIREDDKLVLITNPMRLGKNAQFVDDNENYKVMRLYVDYSIATDVKEVPRALFETSYLDQDYPFNEKKYIEEKLQFTIQNEYHLGKEPIYRDESLAMVDIGQEDYGYILYQQPLMKNHDYEIVVPNQNAQAYVNERANIKQINIRLFDIQGNVIDTLEYQDSTSPMPSIYNLRTFNNNTISFFAYNNDIISNNIYYDLDDGAQTGAINNVQAFSSVQKVLQGVSFGRHKLELFAQRSSSLPFSDRRVLYFQMPDGVYDEDVYTPIVPSLPPIQVSATAIDTTFDDIADRLAVSWLDQNGGSEKYRIAYRIAGQLNIESGIEVTETNYNINFSTQDATTYQDEIFEIDVEAFYENQWSSPTSIQIALTDFNQLPENITDVLNTEIVNQETGSRYLKFYWTDLQYESTYKVYYKFTNDNFATLNDYPANQVIVLGQDSELILFYTFGDYALQIPFNTVIDVAVIGVNQNGTSATPGTRQGVARQAYTVTNANAEPLDGLSGFKVTIPEALKDTATATDYVFETAWEVQYKLTTNPNWGTSVFYPTNNEKNYFEITGLTAETDYDVRFRAVYNLNGSNYPTTSNWAGDGVYSELEVTTGTDTPPDASAPTISNFNYSGGSSAGTMTVSFTLTNTNPIAANLYYKVSTSSSTTVTSSSYDGLSANVAAGASVNFGPISVSDSTTYYVRAVSNNNILPADSPTSTSNALTTPGFVTATFNTNGGVPSSYSSQSGYSPKSVSSPGTPTRDGYNFTGWSPSLPRTISSNTTFNAGWSMQCDYPYGPVSPYQDRCSGYDLQVLYYAGTCSSPNVPNTIWVTTETNSFDCGYDPNAGGGTRVWAYQYVGGDNSDLSSIYYTASVSCPSDLSTLAGTVKTWLDSNYPAPNYSTGRIMDVSVVKTVNGVQTCGLLRYQVIEV